MLREWSVPSWECRCACAVKSLVFCNHRVWRCPIVCAMYVAHGVTMRSVMLSAGCRVVSICAVSRARRLWCDRHRVSCVCKLAPPAGATKRGAAGQYICVNVSRSLRGTPSTRGARPERRSSLSPAVVVDEPSRTGANGRRCRSCAPNAGPNSEIRNSAESRDAEIEAESSQQESLR